MLNLTAPIVPGQRVAGIALDADIAAVLRAAGPDAFTAAPIINTCLQAPTGITLYAAPVLDLWEADGRVIQLRARQGYLGPIAGSHITLGATRAQLTAALGPLTLDDAGNPAIRSLPGLSLAFAPPRPGQPAESARLTAIVIFPPASAT